MEAAGRSCTRCQWGECFAWQPVELSECSYCLTLCGTISKIATNNRHLLLLFSWASSPNYQGLSGRETCWWHVRQMLSPTMAYSAWQHALAQACLPQSYLLICSTLQHTGDRYTVSLESLMMSHIPFPPWPAYFRRPLLHRGLAIVRLFCTYQTLR